MLLLYFLHLFRKGVKIKTLVSIMQQKPSVSIITVTQLSRFKCLLNLAFLIKLQDYSNIIEWIIVEGTPSRMDAAHNKINILSHLSEFHIPVKYIEYEPTRFLSDLRNVGNDAATGDIIVVMDDDDYYPPCRVSHAVHRLQESGCHIAGTSGIYMYDYGLRKLLKFHGFGPNHATNNTMAYTRLYLEHNRHDAGLTHAEERSFTRGFQNSMVQLDADKCIIVSSHDFNTYCKKRFALGCLDGTYKTLALVNKPITDFIPKHIYDTMRTFF